MMLMMITTTIRLDKENVQRMARSDMRVAKYSNVVQMSIVVLVTVCYCRAGKS